MKQVELSRRNFLKWSAGAVAGIALLELDHPVYRAEAAPCKLYFLCADANGL